MLAGLLPYALAGDELSTDAQKPLPAKEGVMLDADRMDYDHAHDRIIAIGNVKLSSGQDRLYADRVLVNTSSGDVHALGNVVLMRDSQTIETGKLHYNFQTREAYVDAPLIDAEPFRVIADHVSGAEAQGLVLRQARATTCEHDHPHTHYHVRARRITLVPEESIRARDAVWFFGRVPVFYLPYWYHNLDKESGWRIYPGYRSRWGTYVLGSYRQPLSDRLRAEHHIDYRTERGFAVGEDLFWRSDSMHGDLSLYLLDDRKPMAADAPPDQETISSNRYRIRLRHTHDLTDRTRFMLQTHYLSDPKIREDFFNREFRGARQPENVASLLHRSDRYSLSALANWRMHSFYGNVNRLPELALDSYRMPVLGDRLFYESRHSLAVLQRVWPDGSGGTDYDAVRMDTLHNLYYPTRWLGWLNVMPRAGYRGTFYSKTRQLEVFDDPEVAPRVFDGDRVFRNVFEVGGEVSFKAFKSLNWSEVHAWRHVVEPYADYAIRFEPDVLPEELYHFDAVDLIDELHQLRLGVRNVLQTKRQDSVLTVADVNIATVLRLNAEADAPVLDVVTMDSRFRLGYQVALDMDGAYSLDADELVYYNTRLSWHDDTFWGVELGLEHRYRNRESNLLAAHVTLSPLRDWSFNAFARYEFEDQQLEEQGGYVQRVLDCMGIRLGGSVLPGGERADGSRREDEYRILLELWLTAFPETGLAARHH